MATIRIPSDFREFLRLLNSSRVRYLLVGGYAVGYYGHPRATGDLDLSVESRPDNAEKLLVALRQFGFGESACPDTLLQGKKILRMGLPPLRIEIITSATGVDFDKCYAGRKTDVIDGVEVDVISLDDLKRNKRSVGRAKDFDDLENLP